MNLLPTEEKVKFKKSYRLKILLVGLFLFAGVLILAIAPIVASYFLISYKIDASGRELAGIKSEQGKSLTPYVNIIKEVNREITVLSKIRPGSLKVEVYDLLKLISDYAVSIKEPRGASVVLNDISYSYRLPGKVTKPTTPAVEFFYNKIMVSGTASDRASLQKFIQLLQDYQKFANVESPISNFVSSKDVNFTLTLSLKN